MAWKQDLAKLKQQLGPEAPAPAPKPLPKPAPRPEDLPSLDNEDAVFLSAMGLKPAAARPFKPVVASGSPGAAAPVDPPAPETFQEAVKDLKGLKPLVKGLPERAQPRTPIPPPVATDLPSPAPIQIPIPVSMEPEAPVAAPPEPAAPAHAIMPLRFQLAAGMALEVDGALDLRGHSLADAIERLKDRLGDGAVLGWRSLQVTLGPDPVLHEGLLALLASGQVPMVTRFAQAPVPMGGNQAWLLYFASTPTLTPRMEP
jgi:hypothetical protein